MPRSRSYTLVALLAVALLFATTMYLSHFHPPGSPPPTHCDLCQQLHATSGATAFPGPARRPTLVAQRAPVAPRRDAPIACDQPQSHRSRAPPPSHLI